MNTNIVLIGITSSGKTFSIGFAFLAGEKTSDFEWALNIFKELGISPGVIVIDGDDALFNACSAVYPQSPALLCEWHIHKCITANCKSEFPTSEEWNEFNMQWREIVQSPTIAIYNQRWLEFRDKYSSGPGSKCLPYLRKEWLKQGQRERLVKAWTSQYMHFGTTTTSR